MLNFPPLSVVAVRSKPLTGLRISTTAFGDHGAGRVHDRTGD